MREEKGQKLLEYLCQPFYVHDKFSPIPMRMPRVLVPWHHKPFNAGVKIVNTQLLTL